MTRPSPIALPLLLAGSVLLAASLAGAVPTTTFKVSTYDELNKGEPAGTLVSSKGEVLIGRGSTKLKGPKSLMMWTSARDAKGTVYFGTGAGGTVLSVRDNKVRKVADLQAILITSLAAGPRGKLLASTMPDARIMEVDTRTGKSRLLAKLPTEHVWALLYDAKARRIYAASGAPGKVFSIPAGGGKPTVYYDPDEKHLLCLKRGPRGALLAGSGNKAILYRITGKGKATAIHDFDATELRDVEVTDDGTLYVAVNKFSLKTGGLPRYDRSKKGEGGTPMKFPKKKTKRAKFRASELRTGAKSGQGALYRIKGDTVEQVLALKDGYFTDLDVDPSGTLWAGEGTKGKVFWVRKDRTVQSAFDLSERQVLSLAVGGKQQYMGTGDGGAIYRVQAGPGPKPAYLSEVLDAKVNAHWGAVHYRTSGRLALASRSGHTTKPDKTWTPWRAAGRHGVDRLKLTSPPGRYLQVKFIWSAPFSGVLRSFTAYYRPVNQRAKITEISVAPPAKDKPRTATLKLKWKVENEDKDDLVYRLDMREEMSTAWRRISGTKPLEKAEFEWDTEPVPDGYYRVRVVASDEKANAPEHTLTDTRVSARLLVDNRKPTVTGLAARYPQVSGTARDSYSPIKRIEYSIDGESWRLVGPLDGIFDSPGEAFRFKLPADIPRGNHVLAVRAMDEAGNMGVAQVKFKR